VNVKFEKEHIGEWLKREQNDLHLIEVVCIEPTYSFASQGIQRQVIHLFPMPFSFSSFHYSTKPLLHTQLHH
jgi:hypothetical protein